MEPYPQFPPSDRPNPFALQDVEQLEPKESQAILDLEDSVSKQGRFRSFRRAATVGIRRSAAECRYNDLQFQESAISVEKVHCCNGLIPFIPFSNVVNFFSVLAAITGICLSSWFISQGNKNTVGAFTLQHFLISATLLFPISLIFYGLLLLTTGIVGLYLSYAKWRQISWRLRQLDVFFHSLIFLSLINMTVLMIATMVGFILTHRKPPVYNPERWTGFIHGYPVFFCDLEQRLGCSAFERGTCQRSVPDNIRYSNCPGVFCLEFCNVAAKNPSDYNVQPVCRPCFRVRPSRRQFIFQKCRLHELATPREDCAPLLNPDLRRSFSRFAIVVAVYLTVVSGLGYVTFYRHCCM